MTYVSGLNKQEKSFYDSFNKTKECFDLIHVMFEDHILFHPRVVLFNF